MAFDEYGNFIDENGVMYQPITNAAQQVTTVTDPTGKYKSDDGGNTWTPISGSIFNSDGTIDEGAAYVDPRGTMAGVVRGMSDDFYNTADPFSGVNLKSDLIKMTTYNGNKGVVDGLKSQGMAAVNRSFDNAQGQSTRNTERYGMNLTKEQGSAQASALSSGKALSEVDALNRSTQFQQDLNKQLVSGMGSPVGITK